MRLIDADELKEELLDIKIPGLGWYKTDKLVDNAPTAYDVDAVVKQIEEYAECDAECREFNGGHCGDCAYKKVIEIVRNGGAK